MAKSQITHACGHTQEHQLYGPHRQRADKEEWLRTTSCTECWRAEQEAKRAEQARADAQANSVAGLPPLTGTPKQIAWAETIRARIIALIPPLREQLTAPREMPSEQQRHVTMALRLLDELEQMTEAHRWIDEHRDTRRLIVWLNDQISTEGVKDEHKID